jgi:hypothetical protein
MRTMRYVADATETLARFAANECISEAKCFHLLAYNICLGTSRGVSLLRKDALPIVHEAAKLLKAMQFRGQFDCFKCSSLPI